MEEQKRVTELRPGNEIEVKREAEHKGFVKAIFLELKGSQFAAVYLLSARKRVEIPLLYFKGIQMDLSELV